MDSRFAEEYTDKNILNLRIIWDSHSQMVPKIILGNIWDQNYLYQNFMLIAVFSVLTFVVTVYNRGGSKKTGEP